MSSTQSSEHQQRSDRERTDQQQTASVLQTSALHRSGPSRKQQSGMGMLTIFAIMAVVVFLGMFAFKVGPNYMENWTVSKIANDVASNPDLLKQPKSKVYSYLNQAYRTNSLWDLKPEDTIKLKKDGARGYIVTVQYEKREPLFHNIYVVTSFDQEASPVQ